MTTTTTPTTYKIKAAYGYYHGTYNAPKDGYLMGYPKYDSSTGRDYSTPLEFRTIKAAYDYLTASGDDYDAMFCEYDGNGDFRPGGQYVTLHGQHSRPVYTIVASKSGRCTKAIVAACDSLDA